MIQVILAEKYLPRTLVIKVVQLSAENSAEVTDDSRPWEPTDQAGNWLSAYFSTDLTGLFTMTYWVVSSEKPWINHDAHQLFRKWEQILRPDESSLEEVAVWRAQPGPVSYSGPVRSGGLALSA